MTYQSVRHLDLHLAGNADDKELHPAPLIDSRNLINKPCLRTTKPYSVVTQQCNSRHSDQPRVDTAPLIDSRNLINKPCLRTTQPYSMVTQHCISRHSDRSVIDTSAAEHVIWLRQTSWRLTVPSFAISVNERTQRN